MSAKWLGELLDPVDICGVHKVAGRVIGSSGGLWCLKKWLGELLDPVEVCGVRKVAGRVIGSSGGLWCPQSDWESY